MISAQTYNPFTPKQFTMPQSFEGYWFDPGYQARRAGNYIKQGARDWLGDWGSPAVRDFNYFGMPAIGGAIGGPVGAVGMGALGGAMFGSGDPWADAARYGAANAVAQAGGMLGNFVYQHAMPNPFNAFQY